MRTLHRKLARELWGHRIQVGSIALVMGCGIMTVMGLRSTLTSIRAARDDYYDSHRLADVFAPLRRAPLGVSRRIAAIPGVSAIETRIVKDVKLDVPGLTEPAIGHVPRGIGDGFRVNVAIIVWTSPSALTIPRSALLPGTVAGSWTAFVLRGTSVEQRQVRIGHLGGADAEVLDGVARGEQVVVFPSDRVKPGARVAPRLL